MEASVTAGWETLLAAELGAAATLLGLVFVGVSINLTRIMASGCWSSGPSRRWSCCWRC